jgi:serine/threonine protein kinase
MTAKPGALRQAVDMAVSVAQGPASAGHRAVLETIYRAFLETEDWPRFGWLDDELDRQGVDVKETLATLPDGLHWPEWRPHGVVYYGEDQQLGLRVAGLALCRGSELHMRMMLAVIQWLVTTRDAVRLETPQTVLTLEKRPADLIEPLKTVSITDPLVRDLKLIVELMHVEPGLPSWSGDPDDVLARNFRIDRDVRRFRGVDTVEQLLAALSPETSANLAPTSGSDRFGGAARREPMPPPGAADGVTPARAPRRKRKYLHKRGDKFGRWTLAQQLGAGGNAEVWRAVDAETGEAVALKLLHARDTDAASYARFRREVASVRELADEGACVLPIVDHSLPEDLSKGKSAWFAMPEAVPIVDQLARASFVDRVAAFAQLANELARLSERGWHHRDLKPANLYFFKGRFVVGDFGLIKRPEDEDLTRERVPGPYEYMPNEVVMGEQIDLPAFDLFCLAKSLWVVLTENKRPPQGQIPAGSYRSLSKQFPNEPRIDLLDRIIHTATSDDWTARGTLAAFAGALAEWVKPSEAEEPLKPSAPPAPLALVPDSKPPTAAGDLERAVVNLLKSKDEVGLRELLRDERRMLDERIRSGIEEKHGSATYGDVTEFWGATEPAVERMLATTIPLVLHRSPLWDDQLRWVARFSDRRLMESGLVVWIEMSRWYGWMFANSIGAYATTDDNLDVVRKLLTPAGPTITDAGIPLGLLAPGESGNAVGTGMMAELDGNTRYYAPYFEYTVRFLEEIPWLKERYGEFAADKKTLGQALDAFNFLGTLAAGVAGRQHVATWTILSDGAVDIARRIRSNQSFREQVAEAVGTTLEHLTIEGNALLENAALLPAGYRRSDAEL